MLRAGNVTYTSGMSEIKWNEVTWYSRLGAIMLFLVVVPTLSFYIGMQYGALLETNRNIQTSAETRTSSQSASKTLSTDQVVGSWVESLADAADPTCAHASAESECIPNDSTELDFSLENGVMRFNSFLHHRPEYSNCTWSLDGMIIHISCNEIQLNYEIRVVSRTDDKLTVSRDDAPVETFQRISIGPAAKDSRATSLQVPANEAKQMTDDTLKASILSGVTALHKAPDAKLHALIADYLVEYVRRVPHDKDIEAISGELFNLFGACWGIPEGQCRE